MCVYRCASPLPTEEPEALVQAAEYSLETKVQYLFQTQTNSGLQNKLFVLFSSLSIPPQLIATHNAPLLCSSSSSCLEEFGISCCFVLLSLKASQGFTEPLVKKVWHLSLISASLSPHLSCFMLFLLPPTSPLICAPVWTRQPGEVAPPALRRFFGRP